MGKSMARRMARQIALSALFIIIFTACLPGIFIAAPIAVAYGALSLRNDPQIAQFQRKSIHLLREEAKAWH